MAGRPRQFDRDQALIKARNLFWRQGYEGTSMSDLVAELGIASARIYKAFGSKEQLFREAIADYENQEGSFCGSGLSRWGHSAGYPPDAINGCGSPVLPSGFAARMYGGGLCSQRQRRK